MTQPNFLSVTRSLTAAMGFCSQHPQLQSSQAYAELLKERAARFHSATVRTDGAYTKWREAVGEELKQLRVLRVELARVVELLDEHGFDDLPTRRVLYTERKDLFLLADELLALLNANVGEWSWMDERISSINSLKSACDDKADAAGNLLSVYRAGVTDRVNTYELAVNLVEEYLRDANADGQNLDGLDAVTLVRL